MLIDSGAPSVMTASDLVLSSAVLLSISFAPWLRNVAHRTPGAIVGVNPTAGVHLARATSRRIQTSAISFRHGNSERFANQKRTAYKRSEEHTSELQSRLHLVCRLLLEK